MNLSKNRFHASTLVAGFANFGLSILQLSEKSPADFTTWSSKFLQFTVWISGFFIFTAFTSDLTATMTAGISQELPKSFKEILDQEYTVVMAKGAFGASILANSDKDSSARRVFEKHSKLVDYPVDGNMDPLVKHIVDKPRTVYFGAFEQFNKDNRLLVVRDFRDSTPAEFRLGLQVRNFTMTNFHHKFAKHSVSKQKNSEFRSLFNYYLSKMKQSGSLEKLGHFWLFDGRPEDLSFRIFIEEARRIGYENLFLPASLLAGGICCSFVFVYCEVVRAKLGRMAKSFQS